ncbi:unnamed protein product [Rhodiola kirilowii]
MSKQMSQIATTVSELKNDPGRLPSQTIQNPRGNVNAVTLRSGRNPTAAPTEPAKDIGLQAPKDEPTEPDALDTPGPIPALGTSRSGPVPALNASNINVPLPFPMALKKFVMDKEVWELFSKVEINIPLLEAIKQIPWYAKFLKELCTNRRRSTQDNQELLSKNVSAVIQRKLPPKCGDPGTYTIPCTIGNIRIENCMLDLGASINVLPYSIYSCLRIGPLQPAGLTIQLADRSCKQPEGKI